MKDREIIYHLESNMTPACIVDNGTCFGNLAVHRSLLVRMEVIDLMDEISTLDSMKHLVVQFTFLQTANRHFTMLWL